MGCDIHLYTERLENGKWVTADRWTPDEYEPGRMCVEYENRIYSGRSYYLFSILADVRNGRGFAGVKTGEGFIPISEPKGIPEDCCAEYRRASDEYGSDGHSHSYFTVAELLAYDWTQVSCLQGWINGPEFAEWNRYRRSRGKGPEQSCGGVDGPDVRHLSLQEMESETAKMDERQIATELHWTYCLAEWTEPYYQCAKGFLSEAMPKLWAMGKPDDVRIVFFFDN